MVRELFRKLLVFLLKLLGYVSMFIGISFIVYLIEDMPEPAAQTPARPHTEGAPYEGSITLYQPNGTVLKNVPMPPQYLRENYKNAGMHAVTIGSDEQPYTLIAYDQERNPYFANGYLIGYAPYPIENKWEPLRAIALRLRYQLDDKHFPGFYDIWLTSRQAYMQMRGDCEDHALLLADWLISMGYDARVALGTYKGGGHAWVILFEGEKTYLLEATTKIKNKIYPLASLMSDYQPDFMFNRTEMWVNTGTRLTTDYRGKAWARSASFRRYEP